MLQQCYAQGKNRAHLSIHWYCDEESGQETYPRSPTKSKMEACKMHFTGAIVAQKKPKYSSLSKSIWLLQFGLSVIRKWTLQRMPPKFWISIVPKFQLTMETCYYFLPCPILLTCDYSTPQNSQVSRTINVTYSSALPRGNHHYQFLCSITDSVYTIKHIVICFKQSF